MQARLQRVPGNEVMGRVSRLLEWVGLVRKKGTPYFFTIIKYGVPFFIC